MIFLIIGCFLANFKFVAQNDVFFESDVNLFGFE